MSYLSTGDATTVAAPSAPRAIPTSATPTLAARLMPTHVLDAIVRYRWPLGGALAGGALVYLVMRRKR